MTMPSARCVVAAAVVDEDGARDHRRRREAVVALDARSRRRWRPAPRARCAAPAPTARACPCPCKAARRCRCAAAVLADRLRDGQDVRLVERAAQATSRDGRWCRRRPAAPDPPRRACARSSRARAEVDRPACHWLPVCRPAARLPCALLPSFFRDRRSMKRTLLDVRPGDAEGGRRGGRAGARPGRRTADGDADPGPARQRCYDRCRTRQSGRFDRDRCRVAPAARKCEPPDRRPRWGRQRNG